ncbi:MAG: PTS-dependent dihydroxyacetone kinase phosphotransferase subunit DhaM [Firmicutes bacterium]|nr:PTS-dependent dihydroxyacetone kinase phosphotransferase subunit DhaM [Bacillota bacterium]
MVGVVIVSHSLKAAEGIKEIAQQMGSDVPLAAVGGTADGRIGTDPLMIKKAIEGVMGPDGVLLLVDLGSAVMNAQLAVEMLGDEDQEQVVLSNAPILEGAVVAVVESAMGHDLERVKRAAEEASHMEKLL